ncbi:MAG: glycosyltransferase family 9 protein [Pirellulales bacterium]|nr:glycosyltransferase family 9 protein [Pirellulales bacterium]
MPSSFHNASPRRKARPRRRPPAGRYRYVRRRWHAVCALIDWLGWRLWRVGRRLTPPSRHLPPQQVQRILIVQLDHLGDAIITLGMLPALRERFPSAEIHVLAAPWNAAVFVTSPHVARVHISRLNRFARGHRTGWLWAQCWWGWRLRRWRYDLAIDVRGELPLVLLLWLSGARRRLGWDGGGGGFLLTDRAAFVPGRPELLSRLALIDALGLGPQPARPPAPPWYGVPEKARRKIRVILAALDAPRPLLVLHLAAGTPAKCWPAAHWRELLGRLIVEHAPAIILVGTRQDRPLAHAITGNATWPGVHDLTGALTVPELAALLEQADLAIGGDSGPAHLAAAVGTPVLSLFSGTNLVSQWRPWGRHVSVLQYPVPCSPCFRRHCPWWEHPCMSGITPAQVAQAAAAILGASRQPVHPLGRLPALLSLPVLLSPAPSERVSMAAVPAVPHIPPSGPSA